MPDYLTYRLTTPALLFLSLLAGMAACGILSSDDPPELEPGPRNYEWTVDSVYSAPGGWMNTIWGSSPDDVWIASSGGSDKLWHFDGNNWEPNPEHIPRSIYSIYGFARDNAWMGTNGIIYHYDGNEWSPFYTYQPEGMKEPIIYDMWGTSPSDIYAVGSVSPGGEGPYRGFILHYDGAQWKELLVTNFGVQFQLVRKGKQGVFIKAAGPYTDQLSGQLAIYEYRNGNLTELLSVSGNEKNHLLWVNTIDKDVFLVDGNNLKKHFGGTLIDLNEQISAEMAFSFFARHKKDVFLSTSDGMLHYNGEDVRPLIGDIVQPSVVLLEKDVFFFKNDYEAGTNVIYHGTLTEEEEE